MRVEQPPQSLPAIEPLVSPKLGAQPFPLGAPEDPKSFTKLLSKTNKKCHPLLVGCYHLEERQAMKRSEMVELLNHEMEQRNARLVELNREAEIRKKDVREIQSSFERGEVRTREQAAALVEEVEQHLDRLRELRKEVRLMTIDLMFDLKAINEAKE